MKTIRTRIAAILLVAAMGITMSACNKDEENVTPATEGAAVSDNGDNTAETNGDNSANNNENATAANNGDNSGDNNTAETTDIENTLKH